MMWIIAAKHLIPKGYQAMAIFPFIILKNASHTRDSQLVTHERIHLRQQAEMIVLPFFIWYMAEYVIRRCQFHDHVTAYRNISFEREAYENEKSPDWLVSRPFWNFIRYL